MHLAHRLHSIQPVELERTPIKSFREVAVAREVLLLDFEVCRPAGTVVHIVSVIHRIPNVQALLRILGITFADVKLSSLLEASVLRIGINSFSLEGFFDDFAFDQLLSPSVVLHGADDFRICGDGVLLDVGVLWALIILNPRGSVLLVGGVVEGALGGSGEGVVS